MRFSGCVVNLREKSSHGQRFELESFIVEGKPSWCISSIAASDARGQDSIPDRVSFQIKI